LLGVGVVTSFVVVISSFGGVADLSVTWGVCANNDAQHIITEIATVLESFVNIFASLAKIVVLSLLRF
jgi:hypothetical protein